MLIVRRGTQRVQISWATGGPGWLESVDRTVYETPDGLDSAGQEACVEVVKAMAEEMGVEVREYDV